MTQLAMATTLRFFAGNTDVFKWQNFWVDKTIDGYSFHSFQTSDIYFNRSADEGGLSIEMAATQQNLAYMEAAINEAFLIEIQVYEFNVDGGMPSSIGEGTMVARFIGEAIEMNCDLTTLTVTIGAGIDAVTEDIPGRKFTTSLVGRLPVL
mgnify:CR=1 FL=1